MNVNDKVPINLVTHNSTSHISQNLSQDFLVDCIVDALFRIFMLTLPTLSTK